MPSAPSAEAEPNRQVTRARDAACVLCGTRAGLGLIYRCQRCGGPLDIRYDYTNLPADVFRPTAGAGEGIWRYAPLLPTVGGSRVSLGEGGTPLLRVRRLGRVLGLESLWVKDETRQPTGSFKDRPMSVAVSRAVETSAPAAVTASTGNAAASMAAYAARAGLPAVVLVPADTPVPKLLQIAAPGTKIVRVTGTFSDCSRLAQLAATEFRWCNVTSTFENPYSVEGDKTVAYEIAAALGWRTPSAIIVPVGSGPLLVGIAKGFDEMRGAGLLDRIPRLIAAQAAGCAPIARAFARGAETVDAWETPETVATGIRDPLTGYAADGTYTLRVVHRSGGGAVAVSDDALLAGTRLLAETEGLYVEPSVGAAVAAVPALLSTHLSAADEVVIVSTGHGLKQSAIAPDTLNGIPEVPPGAKSLSILRQHLPRM